MPAFAAAAIALQLSAEVLAAGGSISHHHGVGKLRLPFVPDIMSPASIEWRARLKAALDPDGVFATQAPLPSGHPVAADA